MKSLDRVQIIGWLGKDLTVKTTAAGRQYASFQLSTVNLQETTDGKLSMKTNWHTVWG